MNIDIPKPGPDAQGIYIKHIRIYGNGGSCGDQYSPPDMRLEPLPIWLHWALAMATGFLLGVMLK